MRRTKTKTFITELPLVIDSKTDKRLRSLFQAGRQLYNACLSEAETRMKLVKQSDAYKYAKTLSKGKARNEAFKKARSAYRYSEYELHSYATLIANKSKWIAANIDSNTQQKLANECF